MSTTQLDNSEVSRHLGQASDYARDYDSSLLVRESRQGNRKHLNLKDDNLPFCGYDVWNAYEVSCMTKLGRPVTAVAKIVYPCDNKYIVDNKTRFRHFFSSAERILIAAKENKVRSPRPFFLRFQIEVHQAL